MVCIRFIQPEGPGLSDPGPPWEGWRSFLFQIKPLHHRIQACRCTGEYAGAAGRRHSQKIGVAHSVLWPPVLPALSIPCSQAPASQSMPLSAIRFPQNTGSIPSRRQIGAGPDSRVMNPLKHLVRKRPDAPRSPTVYRALPAYDGNR